MSNSLILAVHSTHVKHKPCIWPRSPQVQRSSVVRASDQCTVGHIGSINVVDLNFSVSSAPEMLITALFFSPKGEIFFFYFRGQIRHKPHTYLSILLKID